MKKIILGLAFVFLFAGTVSAVDLFYDDFESGNLNGWDLSSFSSGRNWTANQTNPYQGNWHAQSRPLDSSPQPTSVLSYTLSTFGFSNITFSYYRKLVGFDAADEFKTKWFNGTAWLVLENSPENSTSDANYSFRSYSLPASANGNSNFKIRFECSANALSEYCRVDNVRIAGQSAISISNLAGSFEYMTDRWYSVLVDNTADTVVFTGLNASNQNDLFTVPFNVQGFAKRINYVWFKGWFDNQNNLNMNQYVGTGVYYSSSAYQVGSQSYSAQVTLPNSVYLGITSPFVVNITADMINRKVAFEPLGYSGMESFAYSDPVWNASGHSYGAVLYQARLLPNDTFEVSEWVKEDLATNPVNPKWVINLTYV